MKLERLRIGVKVLDRTRGNICITFEDVNVSSLLSNVDIDTVLSFSRQVEEFIHK
jgi:hypothetical protein